MPYIDLPSAPGWNRTSDPRFRKPTLTTPNTLCFTGLYEFETKSLLQSCYIYKKRPPEVTRCLSLLNLAQRCNNFIVRTLYIRMQEKESVAIHQTEEVLAQPAKSPEYLASQLRSHQFSYSRISGDWPTSIDCLLRFKPWH